MTSTITRTFLLAGLIALPAFPAFAQDIGTTRPVAAKTANAQCMLDDGYGRLRSCSQGYKKANPNWRTSDNCYTDDGYGRYRSCEAGSVGYKRKAKN